MNFALIDEFEQTLGDCHDDLLSAEKAVQQLGENAGEVVVVELSAPLPDMSDLNEHKDKLTGKRWNYDFITEKFIPGD